MSEFTASILLLSEDGAGDATETLSVLAKKIVRLIDPRVQTQKIDLEPLQNPEARRALTANLWRSTRQADQRAIVALRRAIASKLQERNGFVLFHYDGDRTWSDRKSSDNVGKFESFRTGINQVLLASEAHRVKRPVVDEGNAARTMARLFELVPFYSVESWLFQNTEQASLFCARGGCAQHAEHNAKLDRWRADRGLLDEVFMPKGQLCFGSRHNLELARSGFPDRDVEAAQKSFASSVEKMRANPDLISALEQTYS